MSTTPLPLPAPQLNWLELLGGPYDDLGFVVDRGSDGAIHLGGESDRGAWDGHSPAGLRDGFLSRYNLAGQRLWSQWFASAHNDQVRGISLDPYGALYVSGGTQGLLSGGAVNGNPASDGFLSRLEPSGQKLWTLQLGAESWDLLRSLAASRSDSSVYGIGYTSSQSFSGLPPLPAQEEGPDAFVIKVNANGQVAWATRIGSGKQDYGMNIAVGSDGFIYATGFSGNSTTDSPAQVLLSKLNAGDGSVVWTRQLGTSLNDYGEDLTIGADGSIYVAISTDGDLGGQINQGNRDIAVQKYDRDGNLIWTVLHGTPAREEARFISTGPDGALYVSGHSSGDLGGQKNQGGEDGFVTRISAAGVIEWTRLFGTAADDVAWGVSSAGNNSLIVSGLTNGNLEGRRNSGGQDAFIASLDLAPPAPSSHVSLSLNRDTLREGDGTPLIVTFLRSGSWQDPLTVSYRIGGSASADDHSGAVPGTNLSITLPAGLRSQSLTITPRSDALWEVDESIEISLNPSSAYGIGTPSPLRATLLGDNNHTPIAVSSARLVVRPGNGVLQGQLSASDPDRQDQAFFRLLRPAPAGFELQENGSWRFDPATSELATLAAGARRSLTLLYAVEDRLLPAQPSPPADVIRVGGAEGQFSTIQAALDQAPAGAVLLIAPGSYSENLTISKPVTLLGAFHGIPGDAPSRGSTGQETLIQGYHSVSAAAAEVVIDGVTLVGDPARGVNLRMQAARSRLANSIITAVKPQGGYADFAYVRYAREASASPFTSIAVENNVFNGTVDFSATPVVLQLNRADSVLVRKNSFLNTGGGGNIVLAEDSGDLRVESNLILGGGKGIATYNGVFQQLQITNNTILDSNLNGIDLNFGSVIKSGRIEANTVQGSGINRSNLELISANLHVSSQAQLWADFQIGDNDLRHPFGSNATHLGFAPAASISSFEAPSEIGLITIELEAAPATPAAPPALPLARSSDAARFAVSRFASGLGFPSSMAELSDGSLLVATTLGDP
ncbi:MAG: VCBS domain-containing protein, partial [Cyanobacteriota bacterium]|nr:VCBS domain-containing protein [Cyanobacteriota bacterium]